LIRADLHLHTVYSGDSNTSLEQVIARCLKVGINCIAITDHNTIAGAIKMQRMAPFQVIVGDEIQTNSGEIIGYFLSEEVPKGLPAEETARRIKEQGGLVCIPHPFDRLRNSTIHRQTLEEILPYTDIIEVLNSRLMLRRYSVRAERFAQAHGLLASAGSDAHTPGEIGHSYMEMPTFDGRDQFLTSLAQGRVMGHRTAPWTHLHTTWIKLVKALITTRPNPA
jgi:predicted metal-dependent phosphoesterase TrpH